MTQRRIQDAKVSNWFLTEVGPAAGGEAEDGLENILIGLAAVITQRSS